MEKKKRREAATEIFDTLGDFTSKENWDKFFTVRGSGDSFEWYAEWPELRDPLLAQLKTVAAAAAADPLQILVPGCGSSRVSEYLYDDGFRCTTNIDFSKVVVSDMLRRYVRSRPEMRWRVMDMTELQFAEETFDVIFDKGGLDALMEPEHGAKLGTKYLKEVKRVLKSGGKFLCLTLAESHVLALLFTELRFGWDTSIAIIPQKIGSKSAFQTFLLVAVKGKMGVLNQLSLLFEHHSINLKGEQVHSLLDAVENENKLRSQYSSGDDIVYSLEDLQLGARGNLKELLPGRRCQTILGNHGSLYHYKAILLDSKQHSEPLLYHCGVFIVPKARANEWLFSSEEGQWLIVESSKAARLIMVFMDSRHTGASMDEIQKDLSPLVKGLAPERSEDETLIPFMMAGDGIKQRDVIHEVTSTVTGHMIVEDVIYDTAAEDPPNLKVFRRLTFGRSSGLVQSEALLSDNILQSNPSAANKKGKVVSSRSRKKGGQKRSESHKLIHGSKSMKVDHSCLASLYHSGIVSGFALIATTLEHIVSSGKKIRTYIIGLGAGLLPMFLRACLPFLQIEVVELDPIVLDLASEYFSFVEDDQLKVHIADGIHFIRDVDAVKSFPVNGTPTYSPADENKTSGTKILIIDADSSDLSSGLSCPPTDFVEDSFLLSVRDFLSEGGIFIINLVSRSAAIKEKVILRLKAVFNQLFSLELEEDVNEILFAFPAKMCVDADNLPEAVVKLNSLMKIPLPNGQIESGRFRCLL
ncbi:eEF1A lysine and N-terminal methyltransferase-like isoform X1 [Zingiber officinale]|uniref:eEF1A lysine and N-terminal methyltransferase-like isoform X1 n=2 Tax=Zingiber officinale TaxID=94328 RepID=UPI001C4DC1A0|nr:eEF1A lysine and N-terminal methyltransferase-like isoform X1 [Zingiber officinale]